jgi:hypothetical protein
MVLKEDDSGMRERRAHLARLYTDSDIRGYRLEQLQDMDTYRAIVIHADWYRFRLTEYI